MTDPFADWEWREFPIATTLGVEFVVGWVNDMLAVHKGHGRYTSYWVLTHLPTGFAFTPKVVFANAETAVVFANRLRPCRNDWRLSDPDEIVASITHHVDRLVDEMGLQGVDQEPVEDRKRHTVTDVLGDIYGAADMRQGN